MKIHFSNVNFSSTSGPNSFGGRLAEQLTLMGNEIVENPNKHYDVFLAFIEPASKPRKGSKTVQRLDGIWFSPDEYHSKNRGIKRAYDSFKTVIWQSEFDKAMTEKHWGKRNGYVIHNGMNLSPVSPYQMPKNFEGFPKDHKYFICSSSWHGQKRLEDNIRLFSIIRKQLREKDIDSTLLVLGEVSEPVKKSLRRVSGFGFPERIAWLGRRSHQMCLELFALCASTGGAMIHLAFLDHCPNVVVESLAQDCPVICTDSGGTKEIIGESGIIIPEKTPYKFELLDYDNPFELDLESFVYPEKKIKVNNNHLDIETVARRYLGAMRR